MNTGGETVIRRTVIERGLRVGSELTNSTSIDVIKSLTTQHASEKRELQELNDKFSTYLDRVKYLEAQNRKLQLQLDELRQTWGKLRTHIFSRFYVFFGPM